MCASVEASKMPSFTAGLARACEKLQLSEFVVRTSWLQFAVV